MLSDRQRGGCFPARAETLAVNAREQRQAVPSDKVGASACSVAAGRNGHAWRIILGRYCIPCVTIAKRRPGRARASGRGSLRAQRDRSTVEAEVRCLEGFAAPLWTTRTTLGPWPAAQDGGNGGCRPEARILRRIASLGTACAGPLVITRMSAGSTFGIRCAVSKPLTSCSTSVSCV